MVLSLKPEDEKKLHPEALEWFNLLRNQIKSEVPLDELTDDNLNIFLTDAEKHDFISLMGEIGKELSTCINKDEAPRNTNSLDEIVFNSKVLQAEINLLVPMNALRTLLRRGHERKLAKVREEQRELEEEQKRRAEAKEKREAEAEAKRREQEADERWRAAYNAVNPPTNDAKTYLNRLGEYDKFIQTVLQAIKVYQERGEGYLNDSRTFDYRWCLRNIERRKEEEQIRNDANVKAQAFRARLEHRLKEIERVLSPEEEKPAEVFGRWCSNNRENRYLGETFADILDSDDGKSRKWTQGYVPAAEDKLQRSIPEELRDFILTQPTAAFFLLPKGHYAYYGVPCLDFYFDVFAVVTVTVLAQAGHKVFNGHKFNFMTNLREPKCLGYYQITVLPKQPHFWQSVPLTILSALVSGNPQPQDATILERMDRLTIYEVKNFAQDVCEIPVSFERYCRSLGSIDKMKEMLIIDERTAEILGPLLPIRVNQKDIGGKKAKAFSLFRQGKRPSDSEIKTLGIKPETAYRYYQLWKKTVRNG